MYKFNQMKQALADSIEEGYIRYENSLHIYRLYRFLKVSQKVKKNWIPLWFDPLELVDPLEMNSFCDKRKEF